MADFCWDCLASGILPEAPERNELAGLCAEGETVAVLCEGCGPIVVDHLGRLLRCRCRWTFRIGQPVRFPAADCPVHPPR